MDSHFKSDSSNKPTDQATDIQVKTETKTEIQPTPSSSLEFSVPIEAKNPAIGEVDVNITQSLVVNPTSVPITKTKTETEIPISTQTFNQALKTSLTSLWKNPTSTTTTTSTSTSTVIPSSISSYKPNNSSSSQRSGGGSVVQLGKKPQLSLKDRLYSLNLPTTLSQLSTNQINGGGYGRSKYALPTSTSSALLNLQPTGFHLTKDKNKNLDKDKDKTNRTQPKKKYKKNLGNQGLKSNQKAKVKQNKFAFDVNRINQLLQVQTQGELNLGKGGWNRVDSSGSTKVDLSKDVGYNSKMETRERWIQHKERLDKGKLEGKLLEANLLVQTHIQQVKLRFQQQIKRDQEKVLNPNLSPFHNFQDGFERLVPYHVFHNPLPTVENQPEEQERFQNMEGRIWGKFLSLSQKLEKVEAIGKKRFVEEEYLQSLLNKIQLE